MGRTTRVAPQRRHTLYFLRYARHTAPVFLDTEVDMSAVEAHRDAAAAAGTRYSRLSYVLRSLVPVMERHPECNAAVGTGLVPRLRHTPQVRPKIALDRRVDGVRIVLSAPLPDLRGADLDIVQAELERLKTIPVNGSSQFRGVRKLNRLPPRLGWWMFRASMARLSARPQLLGSVAVSSLGHSAVDGFHAVGGTPLTLNVGRVRPTPVARGAEVRVAPVIRLNLAFDHRIVDGAEAADILTEIKEELQAPEDRRDHRVLAGSEQDRR
ncbi:2-oxo acid dehydrogenase subunit E2 [Lipingzhangella sp. LS1_29]|uniref:2-oxo acid dehydrogenase subunit E2 n=1 Tax=Lipingzhangella rawalii TaxID=2055835 RepID=A0ABU2H6H4_9ACTN|nr:2-oxo acid dehydrogenase subunit E2 [Lipingzhangella rawalii]MDS1270914.1 2-oxo acid dehydrogenase subunit E2 [Lipingzhangella rawalii]